MAALQAHGIATIDLLVVNLYPFEATVAKPGCTLEDAIENIDIGGPAMVRSAAKNWKDVAVLTDASQYAGVLAELKAGGAVSQATQVRAVGGGLQPHQPTTTARSATTCRRCSPTARAAPSRRRRNGRFVKLQDLRYGENPHQSAAFYRDLHPAPGSLVTREAAAGQGTLVQQHRRRRCGVGVREELRRDDAAPA